MLVWAIIASAFGATIFAHNSVSASPAGIRTSAHAATVHTSNFHTVNAAKVPQATTTHPSSSTRSMPTLYGKNHQQALHTSHSAAAPHSSGYTPLTSASITSTPYFPSVFNKWDGLSDASAGAVTGYLDAPPDMAVAGAPSGLVVQAVNTAISVYSITGTAQSGWPKSTVNFFGVPAPSPAGCDSGAGAFMSDPRAWYDPYDNRFGVAMLEIEGAFGVNSSCTEVTRYWVAVSNTPNPTGTWTIFAINMNIGGNTDAADFTQFGFNGDGIYVSANMFNQAGTSYQYAEIIGCGKLQAYHGTSPTCNGYYSLAVTGAVTIQLDTVQPVAVPMSADNSPQAEFFVASYNMYGDLSGNNCSTTACNGAAILAWSDPANLTGSGNKLSFAFTGTTHSYVYPPAADQPGCTGGAGCIDTGDLRVSSTPVYHAGHIFAAHSIGVTNGSGQFVSGIQWWDFQVSLNNGYPTTIAGASLAQDGLLNAGSNYTSLSYPVVMPDLDNDLIMGYDYMGDTIYPSINVTNRRVTSAPSTLPGGLGIVQVAGTTNLTAFGTTACTNANICRYGDYEAMSYSAPYQDFIWFASQYPNPTNGDWNTKVMRLKMNLNG